MKLSKVEALDKLSIMTIKLEKLGHISDQFNLDYSKLSEYVKEFIDSNLNEYYQELLRLNRMIWECKALIDDTAKKKLTANALASIAGLNLKVIELNNERQVVKKAIK